MNKVKKLSVAFHEDIDRHHKDTHKIPIAILHQFVQDKLYEFADKYNLVMIDRNIWCAMNEYFMFFYLKNVDGIPCRIDVEITYDVQ